MPPASSASIQAPIGGWNTRDSIADMDSSYAPAMTNWWPSSTDLMLRKGYTNYATGLVSQVESLLVYAGGATDKMFAAAGTSIFDVSSTGAVGAAALTGLSNARFQYQNIATSGGNFMLCVNGVDKLRGYNGITWWTDGDGTHDITGIDTSTASNLLLFKNRMWFIQKNTLNAYYLPTSSIAGAASAFPLQSVARQGGYLVAMEAWTIDAGYGVDDMLAFMTNKGEVIVYRGTDPASANTWALVGVWELGPPTGTRCMFKFAGDVLILGQDGLTPMSSALQSSRVNPQVALSNIIAPTISNATGLYASNFGWQTCYYAAANMLIVNVPVGVGSQEQYAMNTITKAWTRFTGWPANCWAIYKNSLYFGGNGIVGQAWNGYSDNGANIQGDCTQAFSYFGNPGLLKRWTLMRPVLSSSGTPSVKAGLNLDFQINPSYAPLAFSPSVFGAWDSAVWDAAIWGSNQSIIKNWQGVSGVGYSAGAEIDVASNNIEVHWISTDFVYETGGIL